MKKIITTMVIVLAFASVAFAQPRAIGGRIGYNTEFSYQHSITDGMYVDLTAGLGNAWSYWGYADVTASFDWVFNIKGIWNWFVGPAAGVGVGYGVYYRDYKVTPFFLRSSLALSTESTPVLFLMGANSFSLTTSKGRQEELK